MARCVLILLVALATQAAEEHPELQTNAPAATPTNGTAVASTNPATKAAAVAPADPNHPAATVPGLRIQLAVNSTQIAEPTALAFDAAGKLFVAERLAEGGGRLSRLEDLNGDGVFEQADIWAEDLAVPTALTCYGGGVFIAAGSDIVFLRSTTNSARAELRRVVFSGFNTNGGGPTHFVWGIDNRIHVAVPDARVTLQCVASGAASVALGGNDFAFEPRTLAVTLEAGGQHNSLGLDRFGRRFTSSPAQPVRLTMGPPAAAARNPLFVWPELLAPLTSENGRQPLGLFVYSGGVLPGSFDSNLFFADRGAGVVRRLALRNAGLVPTAELPPGQRDAVFIRAQDPGFRPTQIISGPDGALFIADLGSESLTTPGSPGRIWRVSPANARPAAIPDFGALKTTALIPVLSNPNGWARDTAARLLFERNDNIASSHLRREMMFGRSAQGRLHALHLLAALETLTPDDLVFAVNDSDAAVREAGLRLAEPWVIANDLPEPLWKALANHVTDAAPRVRHQLALTLGASPRNSAVALLADLLSNDPENRWMQMAVFGGATGRADALFTGLLTNARFRRADSGWAMLQALAEMAGNQPGSNGDAVLLAIERAKLNTVDTYALAHAFARGLRNSGRNLTTAAAQGTWKRYAAAAMEIVLSNQSEANRAAAARYLGVSGYTATEVADWALALLVPGEPQAVQSAAIESLSYFDHPLITAAYVQRWDRLTETSRREMLLAMLRRPDRTYTLMNAFEARQIPLTALTPIQANFLRTHYDANTATRARRLLGGELNARAGLTERLGPAVLKLEGNATRGRTVFQNRCASCHRATGGGRAFGPDLDLAASRTREEVLTDILEPNRRITATHQTQVVFRTNGDFLIGLVEETAPTTLRVRHADGTATFVPRAQINNVLPQEWSLMPEDAAAGLNAGDLADLLAFLQR